MFHHYSLEVLLYKIAMMEETSSPHPPSHDLTQLQLLHSCLQSLKSFFTSFYSLPSELLPLYPHSFWMQISHAIMILSHLLLYQSEPGDWDREFARSTIDYYDVIHTLEKKWGEAQYLYEKLPGNFPDRNIDSRQVFANLSIRIQSFKDYHHQRQRNLDLSASSVNFTLDPLLTSLPLEDIFLFE